MKIYWSKQRCWVCGGRFKPGHTTVTNDKTGKVKKVRRMVCVNCGDEAFSPEQYLARKFREVAAGMKEILSRE